MRNLLLVLITLLVGCIGGYAVYDRQQSIASIDESLQALEVLLEEAETDGAQYSGGLIKSLVAARIETIQATIAMLIQKRNSLIHRIDLRYTVDEKPYKPLTDEQRATLQSDIEKAQAKIADARAEADQYRGGLLKGLILSRMETEQLTLAGLWQRQLLDKYRMPWRIASSEDIQESAEQLTIPDDEAL